MDFSTLANAVWLSPLDDPKRRLPHIQIYREVARPGLRRKVCAKRVGGFEFMAKRNGAGSSLGVRLLTGVTVLVTAIAWLVQEGRWHVITEALDSVGIHVNPNPKLDAPLELPGITIKPISSHKDEQQKPEATAPSSAPTHSTAGGVLFEVDVQTVQGLLQDLEVADLEQANIPTYDRQLFPHWVDVDGNKCDTRNDVLARDLDKPKIDTDKCTVLAGFLTDPYTGKEIYFTRGVETSGAVQIDHVVSLSDAWRSGAFDGWSEADRRKFANDPRNLLAVDGTINSSKRDLDVTAWVPPNTDFHCEFAAIQIGVKYEYGLSVTSKEQARLSQLLQTC